jgi:hypothetical protein
LLHPTAAALLSGAHDVCTASAGFAGMTALAIAELRGTASCLQNVLWNGFLTPEGSDKVPNDLRFLHDMIALLQENKIRKREVSISTDTS